MQHVQGSWCMLAYIWTEVTIGRKTFHLPICVDWAWLTRGLDQRAWQAQTCSKQSTYVCAQAPIRRDLAQVLHAAAAPPPAKRPPAVRHCPHKGVPSPHPGRHGDMLKQSYEGSALLAILIGKLMAPRKFCQYLACTVKLHL